MTRVAQTNPFVICKTMHFTYRKKKLLFAGLRSVRIVKNCGLGLENATHGLRPRAAFSSPRSQFFTIRTSQPAKNIYLFFSQASERAGILNPQI